MMTKEEIHVCLIWMQRLLQKGMMSNSRKIKESFLESVCSQTPIKLKAYGASLDFIASDIYFFAIEKVYAIKQL